MATGHVLVLGGTGEARRLADLLAGAGISVTTSFAGATTAPAMRAKKRAGRRLWSCST